MIYSIRHKHTINSYLLSKFTTLNKSKQTMKQSFKNQKAIAGKSIMTGCELPIVLI